MSRCEGYEAWVSAWLDEELARADEVDLMDHLVRCADCRRFYVEARALDGALALVRPPRQASLPAPETWSAIERRAKVTPTRRLVPRWAMRAAAAAVLALGLGGLLWMAGPGGKVAEETERPADALIALGEDAGHMTEARFIEVTKEMLRAEPRYRTAMYRVMRQVVQETTPVEGRGETEFAGAVREGQPIVETAGREPV